MLIRRIDRSERRLAYEVWTSCLGVALGTKTVPCPGGWQIVSRVSFPAREVLQAV